MAHKMFWVLLLTAVVVLAPSARADYDAGQRAWDAGRLADPVAVGRGKRRPPRNAGSRAAVRAGVGRTPGLRGSTQVAQSGGQPGRGRRVERARRVGREDDRGTGRDTHHSAHPCRFNAKSRTLMPLLGGRAGLEKFDEGADQPAGAISAAADQASARPPRVTRSTR